MRFNLHSNLVGQHAFLSPSGYHKFNYNEEKLEATFLSSKAAAHGTRMHELAHHMIRMGVKAQDNTETFNQYVNDTIGFRMTPEQILYYSDNCFGTADAISFRDMVLRISDLKMGVTPTSVKQLEAYAALFCLEYKIKPFDITIELRIYQHDECRLYLADPADIVFFMDRIETFDKIINAIKWEG